MPCSATNKTRNTHLSTLLNNPPLCPLFLRINKMAGFTIIHTTFLFLATLVAAGTRQPQQRPPELPKLGQISSRGCFGSLPSNSNVIPVKYSSSGLCWYRCQKEGKFVSVLHLNKCFCADTYPPRLSLIEDDQCNYPCPGFGIEACGGLEAYSVFNTGVELDVEYDRSDKTIPSPSASTTTTCTCQPTSSPIQNPSHSILKDINNAVQKFSTVAVKFAKMIQSFVNECFGRPGSDQTNQRSEKTGVLKEVVDLRV